MLDDSVPTPKKRKAHFRPPLLSSIKKRVKRTRLSSPSLAEASRSKASGSSSVAAPPLSPSEGSSSHSDSDSSSSSPKFSIYADYLRRQSNKQLPSSNKAKRNKFRKLVNTPAGEKKSDNSRTRNTIHTQSHKPVRKRYSDLDVIEISDDDDNIATSADTQTATQSTKSCLPEVIVISDGDEGHELTPAYPPLPPAPSSDFRPKPDPDSATEPVSEGCQISADATQVARDHTPLLEDHNQGPDCSVDVFEQELVGNHDPISDVPDPILSPPTPPSPDHHVDVPLVCVKSLLYGGDDGFFKEAFLSVRTMEPATSPNAGGDVDEASHPLQSNSCGAAPEVPPNVSERSTTPHVNVSIHEGDSRNNLLSTAFHSPSINTSTSVSQSVALSVEGLGFMQAQTKSPSPAPIDRSEGQPQTEVSLTEVIDRAYSNSKRGPFIPREVIDLTCDADSQSEGDSENYAPSTVAAAIALGTLLTSKTKESDDQDTFGKPTLSNHPITVPLPQEESSPGDAMSSLQIIRNAMNQMKHQEIEAKVDVITEVLHHTPGVVEGSMLDDAAGFSLRDGVATEVSSVSDVCPGVLVPSEDQDEEQECLDLLSYPPSSSEDDDHADSDRPKLTRVTRSSTPTLSSANDTSDTDNVPLLHMDHRSSESSYLNDTSSALLAAPQRLRLNRGLKDLAPIVRYTKDIPHLLQDRLNQMDAFYRHSDMARAVFEAAIVENTAEDEPKAPRIQVINNVDDESTPPWEFHYSNQMWLGEGISSPDYDSLRGCGCRGRCDPKSRTCLCIQRQHEYYQGGFIYDEKGRLRDHYQPIFECNDACECTEDCPNRVVQQGRRYPVNIVKTEHKGWGVFAGDKRIPGDTFLGIYAGELLSDEAGEERGCKYNKTGRTYLFDIDCHYLRENDPDWQVKYVVDAYHVGNFTRFLNHSCDPNCNINPVIINNADINRPLLAIFTTREVEPFEELCFSYFGFQDETDLNMPSRMHDDIDAVYMKCCCGASNCRGKVFNMTVGEL